MARIATLGSALSDIYLVDHDDLRPTNLGEVAILGKILVGSKVEIDQLRYEVGGGGINSAVTLARHGHEVVPFTQIGRDQAGQEVMRVLDREGIDNSYVAYAGRKTTGTSVILLDSKSGERTILTYRGASADFKSFDENDLALIAPDWLYITTLGGDLTTLDRFLKKAHELDIKVMLNPGGGELAQAKALMKLLNNVNILLVNKREASELVPGALLTELGYRLARYTDIALITDGAMGGVAVCDSDGYRFGIYEDQRVKDATGAGDAFGSGFLAAYADGRSLKQSILFASANATAVVASIGANRGALTGREALHPMPIQKL